MITTEFLKSCTDEQINKGVAWLEAKRLGIKHPCEFMIHRNKVYREYPWIFSPCDTPNDAWPIILKNKISILDWNNKWEASMDFYGTEETNGTDEILTKVITNENPLRAAMEVYILMSTKS